MAFFHFFRHYNNHHEKISHKNSQLSFGIFACLQHHQLVASTHHATYPTAILPRPIRQHHRCHRPKLQHTYFVIFLGNMVWHLQPNHATHSAVTRQWHTHYDHCCQISKHRRIINLPTNARLHFHHHQWFRWSDFWCLARQSYAIFCHFKRW